MRYFDHLTTVEDVKKEYKRLAMANHPDRGGDTATMQAINAQYTARLEALNKTTSKDENGKDHTYYYDEARERAIMDKISEVLRAGVISNEVEFYLIGSWLWIIGETKPIKDQLGKNGLGFFWHQKRTAWYWHNGESKGFHSKGDLSSIASRYGATRFRSNVENELA